jgi:hypothetical protein
VGIEIDVASTAKKRDAVRIGARRRRCRSKQDKTADDRDPHGPFLPVLAGCRKPLAARPCHRHRPDDDDTASAIILRVIERAPQWVRHDLAAKDEAIRTRAEETLAAMIANALDTGTSESREA